uniref:Uncharacterized protein n=1 Tax=Rhizophora mucronata TaxID=61149 RepID=A0A2P2PFD0_RHIMU
MTKITTRVFYNT